ncbi:hypothetical protein PXK01_19530 [Phaeobacter sp. PT47_59]|uniref:hypothetical protein n=1 Tax=Phaeobacter sp. PT47_59 TaxID=3029979 RepID=UPI0023803D51|nr:hypothetical protein [Phaeobacter sp. PT47_59]MDE4176353.1 hypothetical protein [Phaeobacter sp. PT47_59]
MTELSTGAEATTEPMSFEQMAESLIEPEAEEETQDDHAETTAAPDTEEDQTDDGDDDQSADDADDDGEDDEERETEADPEAQLFTVKVDGKEQRVSLEELQRGYSGQQYIQQGMQQVAHDRKQIETYAQAVQQQQQQLDYLVQAAQQGAFVPPTPPDPSLLQTDPVGYMQEKAIYDQRAAAYQDHLQAYQGQMQQRQQQEQEQRNAFLQEQRRLLHEAIPDLADSNKSPALQAKMADIAMSKYGFSMEEVRALEDSRYARALHDLMRFHELTGKGETVAKKAEKARPVAKAGAKTDQKRGLARKQRDRLKATGNIDDAMALMLSDD